jgi:Ni/Fe-hydrogenase subunit HybB-like protein
LIPYPNERLLWPSFHSPLLWDFMAITTYLTCSILFAYISLIPDIALARDHAPGWRQKLYKVLALGWRGSEHEWSTLESTMNVFTYGIIPVMFSVHTVVSWDFAMALQPGWHSTIFGPYFVVGALFSGVGAVIIALILLRKFLHLEYYLRTEHFNGMGMFLLLLSLTWTYFYFNDYLVPWYGREPVEKWFSQILSSGWAAPLWFLMLFGNIVLPCAILWSKKLRTKLPILFIVSFFVQIGMYIERYLIVPGMLGYNEIPSSWRIYIPHVPESLISVAAFALVAFAYILFTRIFPIIPLWEVREGQVLHGVRQIGRALVQTKSEPD